MDAIKKLEYEGFTIGLYPDQEAEDPRTWSNLGTMVCEHRRYTLGDTQYHSDEAQGWNEWFNMYLAEEHSIDLSNFTNAHGNLTKGWFEEVQKWVAENIVGFPVSLYDHSGISMKAGPPKDRWDSGYVGYIYCTLYQIKEHFQLEEVTPEDKLRAVQNLEGEVETYSKYLEGNVIGYVVDELGYYDSCWGYYSEEEALETAKDQIDYHLKEKVGQKMSRLKTLIKNKVSLSKRLEILNTI